MKLVSLNTEGNEHLELVKPFLITEDADTVCLVEAPEYLQDWLLEQGYQCSFAPMCIKTQNDVTYTQGLILASKLSHTAEIIPYFKPTDDIQVYTHEARRTTQRHIVLYANVGDVQIGVTHFTWNPNGETADMHQTEDMNNMLKALASKPPHILCGDLNIPRNFNKLYDQLASLYTDNIPPEYASSLDKTLHRHKDDPDRQKLFNDFMVDYVFTKPPLAATGTRLEFGVSDHAAVVTTISQATV